MSNKDYGFTPIDNNYNSCDYTYVDFTVYSKFDNIENSVSFTPDFHQSKGDVVIKSLKKKMIAKCDLWSVSSDKKLSSKDVRHHLNYILEIIYPHRDIILHLQNLGHKMQMKCVWFANDAIGGGPAICPKQMEKLSDLNLELNFSFYPEDW